MQQVANAINVDAPPASTASGVSNCVWWKETETEAETETEPHTHARRENSAHSTAMYGCVLNE